MSWAERAWKGALLLALSATTWLLLTPSPPEVGGGLPYVDKLEHLALFAALALLAARAYADRPRWGVFAALVFYGACIEIAQPRTGRDFELFDLVADALGAAVVFLLQQRSSSASASARP